MASQIYDRGCLSSVVGIQIHLCLSIALASEELVGEILLRYRKFYNACDIKYVENVSSKRCRGLVIRGKNLR